VKLRSVVRDCLFLNWALPVEALPEPPAPLRYQRLSWQGSDYVFASALLFHHDAVRWRALPLLRVGYPQLNVRLYVLDEDGVPSVLFHRELMPAWVAPGMRLLAGHPAASARLNFPRPSLDAGADSWTWRVERGGALTVRARVHSPTVPAMGAMGEQPRIGSWAETVRFFQERPRGYAVHGGTLRRVDVWHPPIEAVWPLEAEIRDGALLRRLLPLSPSLAAAPAAQAVGGPQAPLATGQAPPAAGAPADPAWPQDRRRPAVAAEGRGAAVLAPPEEGDGGPPDTAEADAGWPRLHSSWLCPEMPFSIVFDLVPKVHPVVQHLPHPAAGRVSSAALRAGTAPDPRDAAPAAPAASTAARSGSVDGQAPRSGPREPRGERPDLAQPAGSRVLASAA
jgi:hypothetical protein